MVRTRSRLTSRLLAPIAGLALVAAALAGCAPSPQAAAIVNGRVIAERDVSTLVDQWNTLLEARAAAIVEAADEADRESVAGSEAARLEANRMSPTSALTWLIIAPTVKDVVSEAGAGVSESQAREGWADAVATYGIDDGAADPSDALIAYIGTQLALSALLSTADPQATFDDVNARAAELDVTLSPRYGTWVVGDLIAINAAGDGLTHGGLIAASAPPWIVQPAPEAA